jgi:hypothetical protein
VSGFSESDRVKTAKDLGAGAYVRKPYVIEKLGLAVREELDRKLMAPHSTVRDEGCRFLGVIFGGGGIFFFLKISDITIP